MAISSRSLAIAVAFAALCVLLASAGGMGTIVSTDGESPSQRMPYRPKLRGAQKPTDDDWANAFPELNQPQRLPTPRPQRPWQRANNNNNRQRPQRPQPARPQWDRNAWTQSPAWTRSQWERPAWMRPEWRRPADSFERFDEDEDVFVHGQSLRSTPEGDLFMSRHSPRARSFFYLDEELVGRRPSAPKPKQRKPAAPFRGRLLEVDDLSDAPSRRPTRPSRPARPVYEDNNDMEITLDDEFQPRRRPQRFDIDDEFKPRRRPQPRRPMFDDDDDDDMDVDLLLDAKKARKTLDVVQNTEDYFSKVFNNEFSLDDDEETTKKVEKAMKDDDDDEENLLEVKVPKIPKMKFRLPRFLRNLRLPKWIRRMWMLRFKNMRNKKAPKTVKPKYRVPGWLKTMPKFWLSQPDQSLAVPKQEVYHYDDQTVEIFDGHSQEVTELEPPKTKKAPKKATGERMFDRFGREFFPTVRDDHVDHFDDRRVDEYFGGRAMFVRPTWWKKTAAKPAAKEEDELFDEFGFDQSLGMEEDKYAADCKAAGGVSSIKSCEADHPKMIRSLRFGKDKVIHCCRVDSRSPEHTTFAQFTALCADKSGAIVKGSACPVNSSILAASQSLAAVCCTPKKNAEPIKPDTSVLPANNGKETLASFRDKCTSKGGIMWNSCKSTQSVLIEKTQIDAKSAKVCCGDPSRANREAYKSYVKSCFSMMGIVYANRPCPIGASAVITQSRFGALEPVVCCK